MEILLPIKYKTSHHQSESKGQKLKLPENEEALKKELSVS